MKKSKKKIINSLKKYVGLEILRVRPTTETNDWSYTDSLIILLGFTYDGCIICKEKHLESKKFNTKPIVLPIEFTDRSWITYKKALRPKNNELNKWRGKKIKRINPTPFDERPFMHEYPVLVSASKYHMVIKIDGEIKVLKPAYANPEDWQVVQ